MRLIDRISVEKKNNYQFTGGENALAKKKVQKCTKDGKKYAKMRDFEKNHKHTFLGKTRKHVPKPEGKGAKITKMQKKQQPKTCKNVTKFTKLYEEIISFKKIENFRGGKVQKTICEKNGTQEIG